MRGVSEVIAIILILMITIAIAGLAYTFMSSTMSSTTSTAESAVTDTTASMLTSFIIESMDSNILYIRNTGQSMITSVSAYVNDIPSSFNMTPSSVAPGNVGSVAIIGYVKESDSIKLVSANGFSVIKTAPDQCRSAVACWRFDEGYEDKAYDSSGNGNMGNLTNNSNGTVSWTEGRFGKGIFFSPNSTTGAGYIAVPNQPYVNITGTFSVSAWVRPVGNSTPGTVARKGGNYALDLRSSHNLRPAFFFYNTTSGLQFLQSLTEIPLNQWTHLAGVYNGTHNSIYINGALDISIGPIFGSPGTTSGSLLLGQTFNGTIDDMALWDRALTAEEISTLYNRAIY